MRIENKTVIKRLCGGCKESFYINRDTVDKAVYYDKKTYHSRCFTEICQKRAKMKNPRIYHKWAYVLENIDSIKNESRACLKNSLDKEEVYDFIKHAYDLTVIPTTIWQKISDMYSGTFRGMSKGMPPAHLLDMWKKKINTLNRIAQKNSANGKIMSSDQRISYDLTILLNKYDSYLKWLEKQEIIKAEQAINNNSDILDKNINYNIKNIENTDTDDISELVEEIFG